MTDHDNDIELEQRYFDEAADERERRRTKTLDPEAGQAGIHAGAAAAIREANKARAKGMGNPDTPVAFWRYDDSDGESFYIGRAPIFDSEYNPLVISWKADAARRFVQSTRQKPLGVRLKRYFTTERNTITDIADDWLIGDKAGQPSSVLRDPILRALEEKRTGRLRDIVSTIQQAQDGVMRADSDGLLVVQGGPGTGKTVIGLQRISLIAYREMLESTDLLFVGPTRSFISYVSSVLPTLGDEGVRQLPITGLSPISPRTIHRDSTTAARVKGDPRMALLLERALQDRRSAPDEETEFEVDSRRVVLSADAVREVMKSIEDGNQPHNLARNTLRERLLQLVINEANEYSRRTGRPDISDFEVRGNRDFNNLLDRLWPTFSAQEFLRDLLASERRLLEHRRDLFTEDEILSIARPPQARISDEPWTSADLALMDELDVLLNGLQGIERYQHVVVDEAQDLSPMQLRTLKRRRAKGMTILGDLAQAIGPWRHRSWDEVTSQLSEESGEVVELTIGYRVPTEVMEVAAPVAASLDLPVTIPDPIRAFGEGPKFVRSKGEPAAKTAVTLIREQLARGRNVGLISAESSRDQMATVLNYEGLEWGDGEETTVSSVTLVSAPASKGLEFDAVVVLEPIDICQSSETGLAELFVALTRTTGVLAIAHEKELPNELTAPTETANDDGSHETDAKRGSDRHEFRELSGQRDSEDEAPMPVESGEVRNPLEGELSQAAIDALVARIASVVVEVLTPQAFSVFVERLGERLRQIREDDPPR